MFVFVDLETTGLNPMQGRPLELGIAIYDDYVNLEIMKSWLITPTVSTLAQMDAFVLNMHTKSGLLDELYPIDERWSSPMGATMGITDVAEEAVKFLTDTKARQQPMTGSTINFDRAWLEHWFPYTHDQFDYHNIDISTLRELMKKYPMTYPGHTVPPFPVDRKLHRVRYCIEDSAAQLKWMLARLGYIND